MLPKSHRLPASEIPAVLKQGRKITIPVGQLIFRRTQNSVSRFAFVVATRVDKRATVRNRLKRLLREAVRHLLPRIKPGYDTIVIARTNFFNSTQPEVEVMVKEMLIKAGEL
ncbi:MAG: ribonuclease P protein component [Patescibacteria group bacterium]